MGAGFSEEKFVLVTGLTEIGWKCGFASQRSSGSQNTISAITLFCSLQCKTSASLAVSHSLSSGVANAWCGSEAAKAH